MTDKDSAMQRVSRAMKWFATNMIYDYEDLYCNIMTEQEYCNIVINVVQKWFSDWISEQQNKSGE